MSTATAPYTAREQLDAAQRAKQDKERQEHALSASWGQLMRTRVAAGMETARATRDQLRREIGDLADARTAGPPTIGSWCRMIISQMVTCPHCRASMPEGTPHRCTSAILDKEKRTRAEAEAAQAAEARGPVRMLPTPAPRRPVAYDPAHPDRDPRVLQGQVVQRTERELLQELVDVVKDGRQ